MDLAAVPTADLLALRAVALRKYSDAEARNPAGPGGGRWTDGGSADAAALRFDDVRRWTFATRDEIKEFRRADSYLGRRFLANIAHAAPTTEPTYRCAFLRRTAQQVVTDYPVGKTIDLPLSSFARQEGEAGGYINGIMGAEYNVGLKDGTVTPVQFRLEPGAKMADLGATGAGLGGEVVTAGRFEVTSVSSDQTVPAAYGSGEPRQTYQQRGVTVIGLRQVGTIKP